MKKLLSFMMAIVLVLSLSVSAFAAGTTGSITINNATKGQAYDLYKIFDATYSTDKDGNPIVSYTIEEEISPGVENPVFTYMFGADGTAVNEHFSYDKGTGVVTRKTEANDANDKAIFSYLDGLTATIGPYKSITADSQIVKFEGIPTGYYLVDRGTASTVTIDSNTPNAVVIDKNQKPGTGFDKTFDDDTTSGTSNIGDIVKWKIPFTATNYDGEYLVQYYSIRDQKDPALWIEFNDIKVTVNGTELGKGYYICAGDDSINTGDWDAESNSEQWAATPEGADWYLIHYSYDDIEIVIPWLKPYTIEGKKSTTKGYEFKFNFDETKGTVSAPVYPATSQVVISYSASVGPDAASNAEKVVKNSANLNWGTVNGDLGPNTPEETETRVYNLGITKIANDGTATSPATRLPGAVFELYKDEACTQQIYVIPTNNEGVYILDDAATVVSGSNRTTSREKYAAYLGTYHSDPKAKEIMLGGVSTKVRGDMTTPASGQLIIMGLDAGTYYLKEIEAPAGYNQLPAAVSVTVGSGSNTGTFSNSYKDLGGNEIAFSVYTIDVTNSQGMELPSTGGEGTMMLITFGTMVALAFGVLLITHKKMSVYVD